MTDVVLVIMDEEAAVVGEDVDAKLLADDLVDVVDRLRHCRTSICRW